MAGLDARPHDEDRLLAWIEAGQVAHVRAVLAIGVDDEAIIGAARRAAQAIQSGAIGCRRDGGHRVGQAEVR
jgi:hypothetical protein